MRVLEAARIYPQQSVTMRYTYLGDKLTAPQLRGMQCNPVRRADGKCIVSIQMATALVVDRQGKMYVVLRRRLRLNTKDGVNVRTDHLRY